MPRALLHRSGGEHEYVQLRYVEPGEHAGEFLGRVIRLQRSLSRVPLRGNALSRRAQMTRPNNLTTNYSYDSLSRLLSVLHQAGSSTIDGTSYTVDAAGNRTAKTDQHANVTATG